MSAEVSSLFDARDQERLIYLAQAIATCPQAITDEGASELQLLVVKALDELSETHECLASLRPLAWALEDDERHGNLTGRVENAWEEYKHGR